MARSPRSINRHIADRTRSAADDRRVYDAVRQASEPWRAWYKTAAWLRMREAQLAAEPLCRMCLAEGRTTPASVADHPKPHRGDPALFWGQKLDSLCKPHHDRDKQAQEKRAR